MIVDNLGRLVDGEVATNSFDKVTLGIYFQVNFIFSDSTVVQLTHKIEVNAVIHQVVLARLDIRRRGEINSVRLASLLHLLILSRQPQHIIVELLQIALHDFWRVPRGIACDEHGQHGVPVLLLDVVNHAGHLVQLFRADVRAVGEAEIDERVFALKTLLGERLAVVVHQGEGSSD